MEQKHKGEAMNEESVTNLNEFIRPSFDICIVKWDFFTDPRTMVIPAVTLATLKKKPAFAQHWQIDEIDNVTLCPLNQFAKAVLPEERTFTEYEWKAFIKPLCPNDRILSV
jgi:hypothetical protein